MSIEVALNHRTRYRYDRLVDHTPHTIRLRPAPHTRTKIVQYTQKILPAQHFINWQQDPFSNYLARVTFPERTNHFEVEIDLIARMEAINPFDFFLEEYAREPDFRYDEETFGNLKPYLGHADLSPRFKQFFDAVPQEGSSTIDFMVALNQYVQKEVGYVVRMEPGVQTPDETLCSGTGSCRDSSWLLVQTLRHLGYAARFVSGYLIQLVADERPLTGPSGPDEDFTDLHAWAEVYLPGAGWVGLDPTSGLFAGEGHIPLACTPSPSSAAPITGATSPCEVEFDFDMNVRRLNDPPRDTKPMSDHQWQAVMATGRAVEERLQKGDVRLTVGGEPTFVSRTDRDAEEWTVAAVGPTKRQHADQLIRRLRTRFAPDTGALHYGQGKWYPGEPLPRWAFELHWREDGGSMWRDSSLVANEGKGNASIEEAEVFMAKLCERLDAPQEHITAAYEDPLEFALREQNLPPNSSPELNELADPEMRHRLVRVFEQGLDKPVAYVLPIQQAQSGARTPRFQTELWKTQRGRLFLVPGDSTAGLRLPLESLPILPPGMMPLQFERDPFTRRAPLPSRFSASTRFQTDKKSKKRNPSEGHETKGTSAEGTAQTISDAAGGAVRTALSIEPRDGVICVFLPPTWELEAYLSLLNAVEDVAAGLNQPVHVEGYPPPADARLNIIKVTPDPGVIEVNIHPARNWDEQVAITEVIYEEARAVGLDASSFQIDGRPTGSGGGNHIVMGGARPDDSPFLRRPDLLASVIRYWQNHPSLSYLFSGLFVGPTSQAPRIDEARHDSLFELEIALDQLPAPPGASPWLVDRLFRNLLIDVTGNTHRAEICIDKLYSPDGPAGRLGLVEFRSFEMPPHPRMAAAQGLLMRALIAWFWEQPYDAPLIRWGTELHDRFLLPHFVEEDFQTVLADLSQGLGIPFDPDWFAAQRAFRFPLAGQTEAAGAAIELRHAIEPWPVLGEEATIDGTTRLVDSSMERMQVRITGLRDGLVPTCNGITLPLMALDDGSVISAVRFRAWLPSRCLHPTIKPHIPLVFDLVDAEQSRSVGGCTYFAAHRGGRAHEDRPINELEAEGRRLARFSHEHTPGLIAPRRAEPSVEFPRTLDLRRF